MIKGHANFYSIGFTQPLLVDESNRIELNLDYNRQNSKSDWLYGFRGNMVDDTVQDVSLGIAMASYGKSHVLYQKHRYVSGHSESTPALFDGRTQNFGFYTFNAMYQKFYQAGQMWNLRADAQWSSTHCMLGSQHAMGGMYSVRGYKENFLGGDSGFTFSAEYVVPVYNRDVNAFTFFDYGHVYGKYQSDDQHHVLASIGCGIRCNIGKNCTANLTLSVPLQRDFVAEQVSKTRLHFMVNGRF